LNRSLGAVRVQLDTPQAARSAAESRPRTCGTVLDDQVYELIHRQMVTLTGGRHRDLDDLVQAAALEVVRAHSSFQGRAAFSTWTYRICYHTLLQQHRWYSRWLRRFSWSVDGSMPDQPDCSAPADEELARSERIERLRDALARLSPKRRAVVVLRDLEGIGIAEIAAIVEANEHTVRSRLRDARKELARSLAKDPYFGDEALGRDGDDS
jgi:RNA polymerase sigma-70 factor (ECF subfamily)